MEWTTAFTQLEETTFDKLEIGSIFAIPGEFKVNRYWRTYLNKFQVYKSPVIAEKIDKMTLQELMTDYPVPRQKVDIEKAKTIKIIPVVFIG